MISFLPVSILGYAFSAGSLVIDKILLRHSLPNPLAYTFYINMLGFLTILVIPFGVKFESAQVFYAAISGIFFTFALFTLFKGLKVGETSVVGPVVGTLNPLFTLILSSLLFNQAITGNQLTGFLVVLTGALILTLNLWISKIKLNQQLFWMIFSGFLWALAYIFLKQAFLSGDILSGIVISRLSGSFLILPIIAIPFFRKQIFFFKTEKFSLRKTGILLLVGQTMGALSGLLLAFATALANPALVNSLFGVQYLVILAVALVLAKKQPQLLDENLSKSVLVQKIIGAGILSYGVYLLSK